MPTNKSFQSVLDALLDSKKDFPRRYLIQFSDMAPLELQTLRDVWPRIGLSRKLTLLEGLETLADEDTLVNFDEFAQPLLDDPDAAVRVHALRLLSESEDAKLPSRILKLLKQDADVSVRTAAAQTLAYFVALGELDELPEKTYAEIKAGLLAAAKGEDDARVRRMALEALGFASDAEVVKLIEASLKRTDPDWQASVLTAMGRSADERWEEEVLRGMTDEDNRVRKAAVQAAGNLTLKSARVALLRMLETEEDDEVAAATIWSLSQIGGEDVRTFLENLLDQTEDDDQAEFLEEALDNLAFTEDLDRFELMSFDPDEADEFDLDEEDDEDGKDK